jgi:hypothetical protein
MQGAENSGNGVNGCLQGGTGDGKGSLKNTKDSIFVRHQGAEGSKRRKTESACPRALPQQVLDLINKCNKISKPHEKHFY